MSQIALVPTAWFALDYLGSIVNRSLDYFKRQDRNEGTLSYSGNVGVTALVTTAVLRSSNDPENPMAVQGLEYLEESVKPDGGIYTSGRQLESNETCLAAICFTEANANHRYDAILRNATAFARTCQWDESKGKEKADIMYGGVGYGRRRQPDLFNTAFLLDVIKSCNVAPSDPSVKKALVFVSRCQNTDDTDSGLLSNNGGFHYACPSGNDRAYGITTMNGLKSLLHAGVDRNDMRIKAAVAWIRKNYDMTSNPGMGNAGLYHYYHACAKTFSALGEDEIEDAAGIKHNWRGELSREIVNRQRKDGSWVNANRCWMESNPHIATSLALLALSYCQQPSKKTA